MTRDQFITKKVLGECWHEWPLVQYVGESKICQKCLLEAGCLFDNPNFSTTEGFFKLWNFCKEQEWWEDFIRKDNQTLFIDVDLVNPDPFADAIARYKGWEEGMKAWAICDTDGGRKAPFPLLRHLYSTKEEAIQENMA